MLKFFLYLFFCVPILLSAQTAKLKEVANQKKKALEEIQTANELLKDTKNNTAALLDRIQLIHSQIEIRKHLLLLLEKEMVELTEEQKNIASEIKVLEKALGEKKKMYHQAIIAMMRNNTKGSNTLLFLLSGSSASEMFKRFYYLKDYSNWLKEEALVIKKSESDLSLKQDSLSLAVKQQKIVQVQYQHEQKQLQDEEANYRLEIKNAKSKEKELNKLLNQKKTQAANLDKKMQNLVLQEEIRQAHIVKKEKELAEQKRKKEEESKGNNKPNATDKSQSQVVNNANSKSKDNDNTNKTDTDNNKINTANSVFAENKKIMSDTEKNKIELSANFASNKGKLPYPITGKSTIVGRFGNHKKTAYVTTSSGGIDIRSQAKSQAKAVFNGEVSEIVSIAGYGTCIILRHGDYFTFYGNINNINVAKGDKVETGQILGNIFTNPQTNVTEMHFQLWKQRQKLNPELWLRE